MAEVTLYALANYNNATLIPKTFDLDDYDDYEEYTDAVSEWLETVPDPNDPDRHEEEWILADVENLPENMYDEYGIDKRAIEYNNMLKEINDLSTKTAFEYWIEERQYAGIDYSDFSEEYIGEFKSLFDVVDELLEGDEIYRLALSHGVIQIDIEATYEGLGVWNSGNYYFRDC